VLVNTSLYDWALVFGHDVPFGYENPRTGRR
jgi:hypothetical protein